MVLLSAEENGFSDGATAYKVIEKHNVSVATNGGFFNRGKYGDPGFFEKLKEKFWDTPGVTGYAFPCSILITNGKLLSDVSHYLPAVGINKNGEIKFGEVKVVWYASCSKNGSKFILDRFSEIDHETTNAVIYYQDENKNITEVSLSGNKVTNIQPVLETDIVADKKPNSFYVHNPSANMISELKSLNQGDDISITYELKAAVYTEVGEANSEDNELSVFFNNCPYVVSGGQLLMYNGAVDPRSTKMYAGRGRVYDIFGTAICIHKNKNQVSIIVDKTKGTTGGRIPKDAFIKLLENENCDQVMSLDGGGSSTMITKIDGKYDEVGNRRVISDILAVMPHEELSAVVSDVSHKSSDL
ncbi:hypothetical protein GAMM_40228 [Gammaproteobacteria bacterium]